MAKTDEQLLDELGKDVDLNVEASINEGELEKAISGSQKSAKKKGGRKPPEKKSASKKKTTIGVSDVIKKVGGDLNKFMYTMNDDEVDEYINSGHIGLNYLVSGRWIDGGYPRRKIAEAFGPSGSAKSTLGYIAGSGVQAIDGIFAVLDAEGAHDVPFMRRLGIDPELCVNLTPKDKDGEDYYAVEASFLLAKQFIAKCRAAGFEGPIHILMDSIAAMPLKDEWEQIKKGEMVSEDQGRKAKLVGTYQRVINSYIRGSDNTLHIINQLRSTIPKKGAFGGPTEITTSGKSTEYVSDTRIDVRRKKKIQRSTFGGENQVLGDHKFNARSLGGFFKITCDKTRQTSPFRILEDVELYFELGVAPLSGMFPLMVMDELIMPTKKGSGRYVMVDPATRNSAHPQPVKDFPTFTRKDVEERDWLFENAGMFGTTAEGLEAYVERWGAAHDFSMDLRYKGGKDRANVSDDDGDDKEDKDDSTRKRAVDRLAEKSGGGWKSAVNNAIEVSEDEVEEEE